MRELQGAATTDPVMTFRVAGEWIAVRVAQMDRVAVAMQLWPIPWTIPGYIGLYDAGRELVPVLRLPVSELSVSSEREYLVAILHVRGESVGMVIERAGHLLQSYEPAGTPSCVLGGIMAQRATTPAHSFWLINTDELWQQPPTP